DEDALRRLMGDTDGLVTDTNDERSLERLLLEERDRGAGKEAALFQILQKPGIVVQHPLDDQLRRGTLVRERRLDAARHRAVRRGDRVTVRAGRRVAQQLVDPRLEVFGNHVLQAL